MKTALITGAARRIGAGCARLLHAAGWRVVLHYHGSQAEAAGLCAELNALRADSAVACAADLGDLAAVQRLAAQAVAEWGRIDALVNNAAQFLPGPVGGIGAADWETTINCNLRAPLFLAQALAPALAARAGCIVNIADIHADSGLPGYAVYSISKAGLIGMTRCLARELAPKVRVNAVSPGAILWPEAGIAAEREAEILRNIPLGRAGDVADIARAVRYLICDADYVTGQVLSVDGGRQLGVV